MSSRLGGALAPLLLVWLFTAMGNWKTPLVLVAVLGIAWCVAFWPWFRNLPEEMAQVNLAERKLIEAGRAARNEAGHGQVPWARMLAFAQRLGALPHVWVSRLQRQLLSDALADLPEEPPRLELGDRGLADLAAVRLRRDRLPDGRNALGCDHQAPGQALGPAHCRRDRA